MKMSNVTIADVRRELDNLEAEMANDKELAVKVPKKLAAAIELIKVKDSVTKDLQQAYTNGEKWWAVKVLSDTPDGCTKENKLEKIKQQVLKSDAYSRHFGNPKYKARVEEWIADKFPIEQEEDMVA